MNNWIKMLTSIALLAMLLAACGVPQTEFDALTNQLLDEQALAENLQSELGQVTSQLQDLEVEKETLVADVAKTRAVRRSFQVEINPEINEFTRGHRLHRETFDELVFRFLPEGAPLREQTPRPPNLELDTEEGEE